MIRGGTMKTSQITRAFLILFTAGLWAFTCLPVAAMELNEAVDNTTLVWTTGGPTPWFGQTTQTHDGVDAAQSGLLSNNQTNWIETTVTGPGVIEFWWKVSSEESYDFLRFYQDGRLQRGISGNKGWECPSFGIGPGAHTLRWAYGKDRADLAGADCGWVDGVTFSPPTVPMIIQQPTNLVAAAGGQAVLNVLAIGQTPLSYQWQQIARICLGRPMPP
jgi:hypothetical protein